MKDQTEVNNFREIINLFRKVISASVCIEKKTNDKVTKQISSEYLNGFINQYDSYQVHKDFNKISFKFSEKEISIFSDWGN